MSTPEGLAFYNAAVDQMTDKDVKHFISQQIESKHLCKEAIKDLIRMIKLPLIYAWENDLVQVNLCAKLNTKQFYKMAYPSPLAGRKATITPEDWLLIQEQIVKDEEKCLMTAFATELLSLCAERPGEPAGLRWSDIDAGEYPVINVTNTRKYNPKTNEYYDGPVKTKKPRYIPLTDAIIDLLNRTKDAQRKLGVESEYVFADQNGPLSPGRITWYIKNKCKQLNLDHSYCSYSIRKTGNSVTKTKGTSSMVAAGVLGHSPQVNDQYYTIDIAEYHQKMEATEWIDLTKWAIEQKKTGGQHRSTQIRFLD